jgi:ribosomal protein L11 methyltransferase
MPWLQLRLPVDQDQASPLAAALEECGAIAVTLEDAGDNPRPERTWEETPRWPRVRVTALFPGDTDARAVLAALKEQSVISETAAGETALLPDQDWERAWRTHYRPLPVGRNLWVCPSWLTPPAPEAVNIILDPGLAFGTGTHATTALCLEWLSEQPLSGKTVIDFGCGSGILAIAALKLGAREAIGIDSDERALEVTRANAARNGVGERLRTFLPSSLPAALSADRVVVNILADVLIGLAPHLTRLVPSGGKIALSGVLHEQAEDVRRHYEPAFRLESRARDGWVLLTGAKNEGRSHVRPVP